MLINNRKELLNFFNSLAEESFYDGLTRLDTKWKVVQISNITFYANSLKDAPLGAGASLPRYITNNHGLANVSGDDNLCYFRCLAVHRGSGRWWRRCEREAKKLFKDYCMHFNIIPNTFVGVNLVDFIDLEDFFKVNLVVYKLEERVAKLIQRSRELYSETMRLNIWENHLSLIVDFEHYCRVYQCIHCGKLWDQNNNYYRHMKTCKTTVRDIFPGGIHKNSVTIFVLFCFICHIYPPFTRKRIVSLYFGREVRTRLGVAFFEVSGPPVFHIKMGRPVKCLAQGYNKRTCRLVLHNLP